MAAQDFFADVGEENLEQTIVEEINILISECQNNSQDAKFVAAYARYLENVKAPATGEHIEEEFENLWTKFADSAVYHPPYEVSCQEGSWYDTVMRLNGTPCVDGKMTLKDTLTRRFTELVPSQPSGAGGAGGAGRPPFVFRPRLWFNQPSVNAALGDGPPQDVLTVREIVKQFETVYTENNLEASAGTKAAHEAFTKYFTLEFDARKKIIEKRVAVLEAQLAWKITIKNQSDAESATAARRTVDEQEEQEEQEKQEAEWARQGARADSKFLDSTSAGLNNQHKIDMAEDAQKIQKIRMGLDSDARHMFHMSPAYRDYEARRRLTTTNINMKYQSVRERLMISWSRAGMTKDIMKQIALDLEQAGTNRNEDESKMIKEFDAEKETLLRDWQSDPTADNGSQFASSTTMRQRAQAYMSAAGEATEQDRDFIMAAPDDDEDDSAANYDQNTLSSGRAYAGGAAGRDNKGRSTRKATRRAVDGRRVDFRAQQKARAKKKITEEVDRVINRYTATRIQLENAQQEYNVAANNAALKSELKEEIEIHSQLLKALEQRIESLGGVVPADRKRNLPSASSGIKKKRRKNKEENAPKKPAIERLTATFGTLAEIEPGTPPAAAEVRTGNPPAVLKKKRRSRARKLKKTGLTTKKTEPSIASNLIF